LLAQDHLARSRGRRVGLVQSIPPIVENPATYTELSREPHDVVAPAHSFNSLSPKLIAVPLPFLSFHFALLSRKVCIIKGPHSRSVLLGVLFRAGLFPLHLFERRF
jgi:hypothetical protein